jgi:hypothetical protein
MTLVSDIITRAFRKSNLIPLGNVPSTDQTAEALPQLNAIILSVVGNEVGDNFNDININTGQYDQSDRITNWVPNSSRLIFDLGEARTVILDPRPQDGQRFAVVDAGGNLGTFNVTLDANGRTIDGAATLVLNTNGLTQQWFYRADLGEWLTLATLVEADTMPFPQEFDPYFEIMLTMVVNPQYGQSLAPETIKQMVRLKSQLNARYSQTTEVLPDCDWRNVPSQQKWYGAYSDNSFTKGWPYPWR